jgi:hypothetical protein
MELVAQSVSLFVYLLIMVRNDCYDHKDVNKRLKFLKCKCLMKEVQYGFSQTKVASTDNYWNNRKHNRNDILDMSLFLGFGN